MLDLQPYKGLPFAGVLLPTYNITPQQLKLVGTENGCSSFDFINKLCLLGWQTKIKNKVPVGRHAEYTDRMNYELSVIEELGFVNYLLMVWDICRFADESGIPRGPGRGSVAGSLVCYLIGITDIDPMKLGLFFSRFLSKARAKKIVSDGVTYIDGGLAPDIDLDFCFYRREEIIDYINHRYPGQTSQLLTVRTFTSRILIKDVLKIFENAYEEQAKAVSEIIQDDVGTPVSIERSMFGDEKYQRGEESKWEPNEQFVEWAKDHEESVKIAMQLEGINAGEGMHASAIAICAVPIEKLMPTQLSSSKEGEKVSVTGYDMYDMQEIALKFDILGLKTVSILHDCALATGTDWRTVDIEDPAIYASLKNFRHRYGIFQLETWAQGTAAQKVKPRAFEQLSAVLAIARPGAIAYLQQFTDYVNEGKFTSVHPLIDDILKPTGGVCVSGDTEVTNVKTGNRHKIKDICCIKDFVIQCVDKNNICRTGRVVNWSNNGIKHTFCLKLKNGNEIRATADHKFLTEFGWKKLSELKAGHWIACPTESVRQNYNYPNSERLLILAYLIAEGCFAGSGIAFYNKNELVINKFLQSLKVFPDTGYTIIRQARGVSRIILNKKDKTFHESSDLMEWLRDLGLKSPKGSCGGSLSRDKFVPEFVFKLSSSAICLFLGSLWECDGGSTNKFAYYKTISKRLAFDVKELLLKIGITSHVYESSYKCKKGETTAYQITVFQGAELAALINPFLCKPLLCQEGFSVKNKQDRKLFLQEISAYNLSKRELVKYGLSKSHTSGAKASKNRIFSSVIKKVASELSVPESLKNSRLQWVEVKGIFPHGEEEVFDIEVEEHHNFVANGIIVHNCVYQEQMLQMLVRVGLTPDEAEVIRRIIGKKQKEKVAGAKQQIAESCRKNGHPAEITDLLLKVMEDSGGYSFNFSHAASYAKLTAATLYYKALYPLEFYWANLQMIRRESDRYEKLAVVDQELHDKSILLLPPRLSVDGMDFKIEGKNIRCALGMIRGVSMENEHKLSIFIDKSGLTPTSTKFEVFQAMKNAKLNVAVGSALIQAGCMAEYDCYTSSNGEKYRSRSRLVLDWCMWSKSDLLNAKERAKCLSIEKEAKSDVLLAVKMLAESVKDEKGNPFIKATRFETIRKRYQPYKEIYLQNSRNERLANFWYEINTLGYSYSETISGIFSKHTDGIINTEQAKNMPDGAKCRLIGFANDPTKGKTKKGNDELRFRLSDEFGEIRVKTFNDKINAIVTQNGRQIEDRDIVIVNCKKMQGDTFFLEAGIDGVICGIQTCKIFTRLSELKDSKNEKIV